jgi:hypothetical protein
MASDKTFKFDNVLIEFAPSLFSANKPQLYLPGMEPFGIFDLWTLLACYSLLDPDDPAQPVRVTLTEFIETLEFSRIISRALGGNRTFPSDSYRHVRESLHRLFSAEVVLHGNWSVTNGHGPPRKQHIELHTRILASYTYIYPPGIIPPDQLPESKRRNVNTAWTTSHEPGPPIYELANGPRPQAIVFRISEDLLRGLTKDGQNIGATAFPRKIFSLRNKIHPRDETTVQLLLWIPRQTKQIIKIGFDKLIERLRLDKRQPLRNQKAIRKSLELLQSCGVVEGFSHDKNDMLTITKAPDWHYPTNRASRGEDDKG